MNTESADQGRWEACTAGELTRMVIRIKSHRRRRTIARWGGVFVTVALLVVAGHFSAGRWQKPAADDFGGIACSEVERLLPDYIAKRVDLAVAQKIAMHLQNYPHCDAIYKRLLKASQDIALTNRNDKSFSDALNVIFPRFQPIHFT